MKRLTEAWFEFKGVNSRDMGILLRKMPTRFMPGRNFNREKVAGRNGSLTYGDGTYNDVSVRIECDARDETKFLQIAAWLTGSGDLRFSDEPNMTYDASIEKEYSRTSITPRLSGQRFTVNWTCHPFKRQYPAADAIEITASGWVIANDGTAPAQPKIRITGSGDFSLSIGGQTMWFTGIEDGIVLDCELMDAFSLDEAALLNNKVSGEMFEIQPGANIVSWALDSGASVDSVIIEPRWRYI